MLDRANSWVRLHVWWCSVGADRVSARILRHEAKANDNRWAENQPGAEVAPFGVAGR